MYWLDRKAMYGPEVKRMYEAYNEGKYMKSWKY
jgi:hypothetical protein